VEGVECLSKIAYVGRRLCHGFLTTSTFSFPPSKQDETIKLQELKVCKADLFQLVLDAIIMTYHALLQIST
jgi:hypothetical protein